MLYIAPIMFLPPSIIDKYKQLVTSFIWNNKPAKIKYTTMIAMLAKGGLQFQDLETKIEARKIDWIKCILDNSTQTPWKSYLQECSK